MRLLPAPPPCPYPCPAFSPRPFQLSPLPARGLCRRPPPCPTRRESGEAVCGRPGARQSCRATAGFASAAQVIWGTCLSPFHPARERHRAQGAQPRELHPSAPGTARPTAALAPARGRRAPSRPKGSTSSGGGEERGCQRGERPPRLRGALRKGGRRWPRSPTRRHGLPWAGGGAARCRRARPATPGSQRPRQAAAESAARHGPARTCRPTQPGRPTGPGGRRGRVAGTAPSPCRPPED